MSVIGNLLAAFIISITMCVAAIDMRDAILEGNVIANDALQLELIKYRDYGYEMRDMPDEGHYNAGR